MKKVFLFEVAILLLGVSTICTQASANDPVFISKVRALSLVKQKLNLPDADYYYIDKTGIGVTSSNGIPKLFIGGALEVLCGCRTSKGLGAQMLYCYRTNERVLQYSPYGFC